MANSRLYIQDTETGERITFAKGWGQGWQLFKVEDLEIWLANRDIAASGSERAPTRLRIVSDGGTEFGSLSDKS